MAPSDVQNNGTTLEAAKSAKQQVHIDIRLSLNQREKASHNASIPTFRPEDVEAKAIINAVESLVRQSLFVDNSVFKPDAHIASMKLPAYGKSATRYKNNTGSESPSPESATSDSDSDHPMETEADTCAIRPPKLDSIYFTPDQIRICVNDNAAHKDVKSVPFILADLQTCLYHALPSACVPRLPKSLKELTSAHPLPHVVDDSLWDSLQHDGVHKATLLTYVSTRRLLARNRVDRNVIAASGMALLHGPPGTGKTSLCRAVAHQMAVRQGVHGVFLHVRMDTIVSKWFGESAKKMGQLFRAVRKLARHVDIIMLLLDEVESVAMTRQIGGGAHEATDPGDGIRLVNATLSGLDAIGKLDNVVVMATSNFANGIDDAFTDRADLTLHVDVPGISVVRHLLVGCVDELLRAGVVTADGSNCADGTMIDSVCQVIGGLSARQICKLPILALTIAGGERAVPLPLNEFWENLAQASRLSCQRSKTRNELSIPK